MKNCFYVFISLLLISVLFVSCSSSPSSRPEDKIKEIAFSIKDQSPNKGEYSYKALEGMTFSEFADSEFNNTISGKLVIKEEKIHVAIEGSALVCEDESCKNPVGLDDIIEDGKTYYFDNTPPC